MSVMEKTGVLGASFRKPYRMRGVTQASWSGVVQLVETPDSRSGVLVRLCSDLNQLSSKALIGRSQVLRRITDFNTPIEREMRRELTNLSCSLVLVTSGNFMSPDKLS